MKAGFHCETAIYVGRSVSAEAQLDLEPFLRCSSAWTAGEEAKKKTLPRISVAERHQCSWEHHAPADPTLLGGWSLAFPWDYCRFARHPERNSGVGPERLLIHFVQRPNAA